MRIKKCKYTLGDMQKIAHSKGGQCVSTKYSPAKSGSSRMIWECADGHRWRCGPWGIRSGSWCPYCQWFFNEEKCRHIIQHLTGFSFPRNKSVLQGLELDGYCDKLSVAFEYNGKQHYEFSKFFHRTIVKFQEKQKIDKHKVEECKRLGVLLIVIPYTESTTDILLVSFIKSHLPTKYVKNNNKVEFKELHNHLSVLRKLNDLAQSRSGQLLSKIYNGSDKNLEWKCKKEHIWEARPSAVKIGSWCPECAGNTKLGLGEACKVAIVRGGKCLSKVYINNRLKLEWECEEGHRWKAILDNVKKGSWCPTCSQRQKLSIDEMILLAKTKKGKCLSRSYVNNSTKLEWQCECGYTWWATPNHIKNGTWCPRCSGQLKPTIANMRDIASRRGGKCLSDEYINAHTKLEWECVSGHTWSASPTNIKQGKWCKKCPQ